MFYRLLYTASNVVLARLNNIPLRSLHKIFVIHYRDSLKNVIQKFQNVFDTFSSKVTDSNLVLLPLSCNYYVTKEHFRMFRLIPGAILLMLRRSALSNPLDFALFIKDSKIWLQRFDTIAKRKFGVVFLYDPALMPRITIRYVPAIIINKMELDGYTCLCSPQLVQHSLVISIDDVNILLGIQSREKLIDYTLSSVKNYEVISVRNPFFCLDLFNKCSNICIDYDKPILSTSLDGKNRPNVLAMEFLSSYTTVLESYLKYFWYLWIPAPSAKLLPYIYNSSGLKEIVKVRKLLIVSPINNFSELGSVNDDRLWINVLKRIIVSDKIVLAIDNT